ncbi:hypothetical protein ANN_15785 [Periplaneta americana]|uniref:Uncharacterized protein n=1 Tax=Periplaneta americana TaxID=6978 RepID=A0ABQ8SH98_PERAM|nr:hypothetical protein ANN_15785 [Periplaneta americana]
MAGLCGGGNKPPDSLKAICKRRKTRPPHTTMQVDDFDQCVIRRTVHGIYLKEKKVPIVPKLLTIIRQEIQYTFHGAGVTFSATETPQQVPI